jgi:hypothetical protein
LENIIQRLMEIFHNEEDTGNGEGLNENGEDVEGVDAFVSDQIDDDEQQQYEENNRNYKKMTPTTTNGRYHT